MWQLQSLGATPYYGCPTKFLIWAPTLADLKIWKIHQLLTWLMSWWSMQLMLMSNLSWWCRTSELWKKSFEEKDHRTHEQVGTLQPWWIKSRSNTTRENCCKISYQCPKCRSICFSNNIICPITIKHDNKYYQSSIWWTIPKLIARLQKRIDCLSMLTNYQPPKLI